MSESDNRAAIASRVIGLLHLSDEDALAAPQRRLDAEFFGLHHLSWRDRLLSWPWRPWRRWRSEPKWTDDEMKTITVRRPPAFEINRIPPLQR